MNESTVRLSVPASPEFLRVIRVTASGLASRLNFDLDDVQDLRLALDEMCFALIGHGKEGSLQITYSINDRDITVSGVIENSEAKLNEFSQQILDALVDSYSLDNNGVNANFTFTKSSHLQTVTP